MTLNISSNYGASFSIFGSIVRIDIKNALKDELKDKKPEEITKKVAIDALKSIERSANRKAFATKPAVIIISSIFVLVASIGLSAAASALALPLMPLAIAFKVASVVLFTLGFVTLMFGVIHSFEQLPKMSSAYEWQADQARGLMNKIKNLDDDVVPVVSFDESSDLFLDLSSLGFGALQT